MGRKFVSLSKPFISILRHKAKTTNMKDVKESAHLKFSSV